MNRQSKQKQERELKPAGTAPRANERKLKLAATAALPEHTRAWLWALLLALMTLLAYGPLWHAGFIWDDNSFLTDNPLIKQPDGLYRFWFSTAAPDYFPLTSTTLYLEWRLWGEHPLGYHLVNLLLHTSSALILWRVLLRLKIPGAWLAAAIFAVHPVNVESVAWITERKNTLAMFFYATTLYWHVKFEDTRSHRWYWLAWFAFLLALLSKSAVAPLPVVLLCIAWFRHGKIDRGDLWRSLPFFAVSGLLAVVSMWFQAHRAIGTEIVRADGFGSRLGVAGWAVWFYLYKVLLPFNLIFVYPRWQFNTTNLLSYAPGLCIIFVLLFFWRQRQKWGRGWLFGCGYYVLMLLPVLGFVNIYFMRFSLVADHWQYFSIISPIAMAAAGITVASRQLDQAGHALKPALGSAFLLALGALTWRQCGMYTNAESLWRTTLAYNPDCPMAHHNLGVALAKQEKWDEAVQNYEQALQLEPDDADVHNDLGIALASQGKLPEATPHFERALQLKPNFADAQNNLGYALFTEGKPSEAIEHCERALQLKPDFAEAHYNLGNALSALGKTDEALRHYEQAIQLEPDYAEARDNLGITLARQGRWGEAREQFELALQAKPGDAGVRCNLGMALANQGKVNEARQQFQEALNTAAAQNNSALEDAIRVQLKGLQPAAPPQPTTP